MGNWTWQATLLMLAVTVALLVLVGNFVVTGADAPSGLITLLTLFGGSVLGVERLANRKRGYEREQERREGGESAARPPRRDSDSTPP